ncbi:MAG TPA: DUF116 domain-containing protein [Ignavibacteriales bacterium]|nr:DUF116 domain-containing protein [Ignavibacteriales bacterium]
MKTITYSLRNNETNSDQYYSDIARFTDSILLEAQRQFSPVIKSYMRHLEKKGTEKLRSEGEYIYEFISMGVYWRTYGAWAQKLNPFVGYLLIKLYSLRRKYRPVKKYIDSLRGLLSTVFLAPEIKGDSLPEISFSSLKKLFLWLEATGEFNEEVKRFRMWKEYFDSSEENILNCLKENAEFAEWFELKSEIMLGGYTGNVKRFREEQLESHKWKEDYIFCGRKKVEYHLGMFGAEVMNRAFLPDFRNTSQKAVLLPACMRLHNGEKCKARKKSLDLICTGCSSSCRINQYSKLGRKHGFEVHIIPHSSDFTSWLKRFGENRNVGVVGVACILNLITGGLEMKELDIAAQCVLLDYCGCKSHWDKEGIQTDINADELLRVLEAEKEDLAMAV